MTQDGKLIKDQVERKASGKYTWTAWPWHPILFALYVVLALLAQNVREIPVADAYRSILVAICGAAALLILLRLLLSNWGRAALVASLLFFLLGSYGHFYILLEPLRVAGTQIGRHRFLLPVWGIILLSGSWLISRVRDPRSITQVLNLVALVALTIPLITVGRYLLRVQMVPRIETSTSTEIDGLANLSPDSRSPDIYYIVLDAYARSDVLQENYGFDNSKFLNDLRARGFYVAEASDSNYLSTIFSLTSSLNGDYLDNLDVDLDHVDHRYRLSQRLRDSWVRRQLENIGYITVALPSSYHYTEITDADYYIIPNEGNIGSLRAQGALNEFESLLIHNSIVLSFIDLDILRRETAASRFISDQLDNAREIRREIILASFEHLSEIPYFPGSKFVFAHIVSPHSPYLFGPNGEHINDSGPSTLVFKNVIPGEQSWDLYRDQLLYVNTRTLEVIDAILAGSEEPPIIILQADHGLPTGNWEDPDQPYILDRKTILNAYYIPVECQDQLYPTISPVNSFRLIFNCSFGGSFPLLEDKTYLNEQDKGGGVRFIPLDEILE